MMDGDASFSHRPEETANWRRVAEETVNDDDSNDESFTLFAGDKDSDDDDDVDIDENPTTNHRVQAALAEKKSLAQTTENRVVGSLRIYLLLFLAVTAGLVGWGTYHYTAQVEIDEFETRFTSIAGSVSDSFHNAVERKLGALDAMSVTLTSHALQSGQSFPMVTLPDFETRAANTRILADGVYVFWLPYVTDEKRAAWEVYASQHYTHIYEAYATETLLRTVQDQSFGLTESQQQEKQPDPNHQRLLVEQHEGQSMVLNPMGEHSDVPRRLQDAAFQTYIPTIWNFQGPQPPGSGPFFALWQMSPVLPLPGILNFNMVAFEGDGILTELQNSHQAVIGGVALNLTDDSSSTTTTEDLVSGFLQLGQYRHEAASFEADPLTPVAYPVFDGFGPGKNFTGALYSAIYWRLLFQDILPADVQGVICVLQNTGNFVGDCQSDVPFTFRLDGPDVVFLGVGDLHDPEYDSMKVSYDVSQYIQQRASPRNRAYTTTPFNSEYNTYILDIYPSDDMKADYVTNEPFIYMSAIAGVFLFVLVSFLLYDWFVERRQRKVMDRAVKSTAVVSSLFPEAVRDQLFKEISEDIEINRKKKGKEWEVSEELTRSLELMIEDNKQRPNRKPKTKAIASKYEATTVLFMDIAGFTSWSSSREPEEVFHLLETLYSAYDAIALRRDVFKVETIGDCYMAVTGIPNPQSDHAYRMAKFAVDCQAKTVTILHQLKETLGEDTGDLVCRIGLHSGPVTAGVLRGDKGRFQLFGDTVNTASRMESTGEKGLIHCSTATADLLRQAGKEHWLVRRQDKIVAKGKGEMDTFWIQVTGAKGTSVGTSSNNRSHSNVVSPLTPPPSPPKGIHRRQYPEEMGEF